MFNSSARLNSVINMVVVLAASSKSSYKIISSASASISSSEWSSSISTNALPFLVAAQNKKECHSFQNNFKWDESRLSSVHNATENSWTKAMTVSCLNYKLLLITVTWCYSCQHQIAWLVDVRHKMYIEVIAVTDSDWHLPMADCKDLNDNCYQVTA